MAEVHRFHSKKLAVLKSQYLNKCRDKTLTHTILYLRCSRQISHNFALTSRNYSCGHNLRNFKYDDVQKLMKVENPITITCTHQDVCKFLRRLLMRRSIRNFNIPPPGIPRAFDSASCPGRGEFERCVGRWGI